MQEISSGGKQKKSSRVPERPPAFEQALRWLNVRWYSELEMRDRLAAKEYPRSEIEAAVRDCRRYGLIDDGRLAEDFARGRTQRGQGSRRIRLEMARHGLKGDVAQAALTVVAADEPEAARRALAGKLKLWSREPDWRKRREKAFRFLAGRGFPLALVRELLAAEPALNRPDGRADEIEEAWPE
ncbi:Regulatory protein RecX [bioreactor metagenome]|uniref:Regulatory protein RecX n=1 Tax=bioreactor metagenome TaxID=1076179 RepID=A0A645BGY7_9ZZZZ